MGDSGFLQLTQSPISLSSLLTEAQCYLGQQCAQLTDYIPNHSLYLDIANERNLAVINCLNLPETFEELVTHLGNV